MKGARWALPLLLLWVLAWPLAWAWGLLRRVWRRLVGSDGSA